MADTCANPLLLGWIKEWLDEARDRNSKGFTVYKKAYDSMKACPLVFNHPSEAQQLNGLGPKLCDRLTEKLRVHCEENGLPLPERPYTHVNKRPSQEILPDTVPAKKPKKAKPYVPALRSGAYALILGLSTLAESSTQGLTKTKLIEVAQQHCDSSFTAPSDTTKFYTAWSSMKTLIQKDLVYEHRRPLRRYALTEEGWEVARRIQKTAAGSPSNLLDTFVPESHPGNSVRTVPPKITPKTKSQDGFLASSQQLSQTEETEFSFPSNGINFDHSHRNTHQLLNPTSVLERQQTGYSYASQLDRDQVESGADATVKPISLPPGSFTVQLILDNREVRTLTDRDYIANELSRRGIPTEVRALELGDATWVAKCHDQNLLTSFSEEGDEVMLDWIVERKRLDDLLASIKDGRFQEQKFRLQRSGMKNVIYLIEEFNVTHESNVTAAQKHHEMAASAIASTQVVNGYFVKGTQNLDDTIRYLARMTLLLQRIYGQPTMASSSTTATRRLALIPNSQVSSQSYLSDLSTLRIANASTTYAVSFATFSVLASKSDILSLRDVFLKMLMCTRGVTGEKALEIQRRWRTPREFIEAFETIDYQQSQPPQQQQEKDKGKGKRKESRWDRQEQKEIMVSERLKSLVGRKKIARTLSKKLAEVWGEAG